VNFIRQENVTSVLLLDKQTIIFTYASFDTNVGHFDLGGRQHSGHRFDHPDRSAAGALSWAGGKRRSGTNKNNLTFNPMLYYSLVFLLIALLAGALGFFAVAGLAALIAKVCFVVFLVLFIVSLVSRRRL
jgi:uncharacterized membrane protein YtjA (UPF0391 family)